MRGEIYILLPAVVIDILIGDPHSLIHPVVIIGSLISFLEKKLRIFAKTPHGEMMAGILLGFAVIFITYTATLGIIIFTSLINIYLGIVVNICLFSTTIAIKGLSREGITIYKYLQEGNLYQARRQVGRIVGRDTERMDTVQVMRAAVESLAENTSDGIIAPLFFFFLGGTPLAMTYKAVNTMDSMLGHKNKEYIYFGRAAALFDDLVNYIPARLTGFVFFLAAFLTGYDYQRVLAVMKRDAGKHPSPNAGYPEAAVAGALGIRLGGLNYYQGEGNFRPYLGDSLRKISIRDIKNTVYLLYWNTGLTILLFVLLKMILKFFL